MSRVVISTGEPFYVDLNGVHDGNRVVALVGFLGPQRVPNAGDVVTAIDNEGQSFDATVESVLPDNLVHLRLAWATRRAGTRNFPAAFGSGYSVRLQRTAAVAAQA
jgi:hypothetical protein